MTRLQFRLHCGAITLALALVGVGGGDTALGAGQARPQAPVFRGGVDVVAVEVQVTGRDGQPVETLDIPHFEVKIDGKRRRVVSLNRIDFTKSSPPPLGTTLPTVTTSFGPLPVASPLERTFVLAVDEASFRVVGARLAIDAAAKFIEALRPEDLVGLFTYPTMPKTLDLTHRHVAVRQELQAVTSRAERPYSEFRLSPSEIVDITATDTDTFEEVVARECSADDLNCRFRINGEAAQLAGYYESDIARRVMSLRLLLDALSRLPTRKTVVIVSGGMITADRTAGRPDVTTMTYALGKEAAIANTNLYVLHVDSGFFEATSAGRPQNGRIDTFRDTGLFAQGLENIAGAAGGSYFHTLAGTADHIFTRVLKETSSHYLVGVEPAAEDRDGRLHSIRVKVNSKGSAVHHRTHVVVPRRR